MARTFRRELLSAGAATALAGVAAVALVKPDAVAAETLPGEPHPDAALISVAGRFLETQAFIRSTDSNPKCISDRDLSKLIRAQAALFDEMKPLVATTVAGHRARARAFVAWYRMEGGEESDAEIDQTRLWPILRDLIGEHA